MKKAAPLLGVSYRTLRYLMDKYGLRAREELEEVGVDK
ncbi:MAG: helix-turn-helix domain-containing protein [Candidatus Saccharicenans sp.]